MSPLQDVACGIAILPLEVFFISTGIDAFLFKGFCFMIFMSDFVTDAMGTIPIADILLGVFFLHDAICIH